MVCRNLRAGRCELECAREKVCPHNDWGREYRVLARAEEASGNYARTIIFQYCVCDDAASSHDMNIFAYAEGTSWSYAPSTSRLAGRASVLLTFFPFLGPFFRRMPQYVWTRAELYALDKLHAIEDFEDYRRHKEVLQIQLVYAAQHLRVRPGARRPDGVAPRASREVLLGCQTASQC